MRVGESRRAELTNCHLTDSQLSPVQLHVRMPTELSASTFPFGQAVVQIHRLFYPVARPGLNRVSQRRHQREHILPLISREGGEHKVREIGVHAFALFARADADS